MANGNGQAVKGGIFYLMEKVGIPMALLVAFGTWMAKSVGDPLIKSHVNFLNEQVKCAREIEQNTTKIRQIAEADAAEEKAKMIAQVLENQKAFVEAHDDIAKNQAQITQLLQEMLLECKRIKQIHDRPE